MVTQARRGLVHDLPKNTFSLRQRGRRVEGGSEGGSEGGGVEGVEAAMEGTLHANSVDDAFEARHQPLDTLSEPTGKVPRGFREGSRQPLPGT